MDLVRRAFLRCGIALLCGLVIAGSATAQRIDPSVNKLMVVLREWKGGNKQDEALTPVGKATGEFDGENLTMEFAWFSFLGDMNVVFVFDEPHSFRHVTAEEFARIHLSPDQAVERAIANIKRVYGEPSLVPWDHGLTLLQGDSPDLNSSYLLDRAFWRDALKQHPEGLVVAVPNRGGLAFTSLSNTTGVAALRRDIAYLYRTSERLGVSSALYLFKDDRWTVFQAPVGR
jgi:uncharacterized protein YtpQ (UPF0354 family)